MFPAAGSLSEFADTYGKYCPGCGQYVSRRKSGGCPHCGIKIEIYAWGKSPKRHSMYVHRKGNCREIVEEIESRIRIRDGQQHFCFTNRDEALGFARVLLNKCGGEKDIVFEIIDAFFDPTLRMRLNIRYSVNHIGSIIARGGGFDRALAYARSKARCERAEPVEQEALFEMDPSHAD